MQQRRSQDLYPGQGEGPGNEVGNAAITIQEILSTGEFGGNMGLFLGCSILTLCEFIDFLWEAVISRNRKNSVEISASPEAASNS